MAIAVQVPPGDRPLTGQVTNFRAIAPTADSSPAFVDFLTGPHNILVSQNPSVPIPFTHTTSWLLPCQRRLPALCSSSRAPSFQQHRSLPLSQISLNSIAFKDIKIYY